MVHGTLIPMVEVHLMLYDPKGSPRYQLLSRPNSPHVCPLMCRDVVQEVAVLL